jgi:hypothetical protein
MLSEFPVWTMEKFFIEGVGNGRPISIPHFPNMTILSGIVFEEAMGTNLPHRSNYMAESSEK